VGTGHEVKGGVRDEMELGARQGAKQIRRKRSRNREE
jgi:hypothetical protein